MKFIKLTAFQNSFGENGAIGTIYINPETISMIAAAGGTSTEITTNVNGTCYRVKESIEEIFSKIKEVTP